MFFDYFFFSLHIDRNINSFFWFYFLIFVTCRIGNDGSRLCEPMEVNAIFRGNQKVFMLQQAVASRIVGKFIILFRNKKKFITIYS